MRHQLRSLLALPIVCGGSTRGAIALATRRPCGLANPPIETLQPLADAAGLALKHALKLSALRDEYEAHKHAARELSAALAARDEALLAARSELAARTAEHQATRHALEQLRRDRGAPGLRLPEPAEALPPAADEEAAPAGDTSAANTASKAATTDSPNGGNARPSAASSSAARHPRR